MRYHIAAAARMSDLSVDVIRAWERRYKIVEPQRDGSGIRIYSDDDIVRLSLARAATQLGHPIRHVATMTNEELQGIVRENLEEPQALHGAVVTRALAALRDHDAMLVEQILGTAAMLSTTRVLVLDVLAPLLRAVGDEWEHGRMSIWQEHLLSATIQNLLGAIRTPSSSGEPLILSATPPFEAHGFGVALAALLAASQGATVYNLGTGMPAEEIIAATRRLRPAIVLVGMTQFPASEDDARRYVAQLDAGLPAATTVWLGGSFGEHLAKELALSRIVAVPTLEEFERRCLSSAA
jgi:DNA-binding transcriptional MerR regulator/methylmalonyl-CoA mutase cobalamin-binding subunit